MSYIPDNDWNEEEMEEMEEIELATGLPSVDEIKFNKMRALSDFFKNWIEPGAGWAIFEHGKERVRLFSRIGDSGIAVSKFELLFNVRGRKTVHVDLATTENYMLDRKESV